MSEDDCNCASKCPDYAHCVCVYDIKTGKCGYICNDAAAGLMVAEPVFLKASLDSRVNVRMNGAALGDAARLLSDFADAEIYVPAARLEERREMYLMDVSLDAVIKELGLMAVVGS